MGQLICQGRRGGLLLSRAGGRRHLRDLWRSSMEAWAVVAPALPSMRQLFQGRVWHGGARRGKAATPSSGRPPLRLSVRSATALTCGSTAPVPRGRDDHCRHRRRHGRRHSRRPYRRHRRLRQELPPGTTRSPMWPSLPPSRPTRSAWAVVPFPPHLLERRGSSARPWPAGPSVCLRLPALRRMAVFLMRHWSSAAYLFSLLVAPPPSCVAVACKWARGGSGTGGAKGDGKRPPSRRPPSARLWQPPRPPPPP